jgi:hypothetical protein
VFEILIQLMILGTLWGILTAIKHGFNQVIAGLEALDRNTVSDRPTP